MSIIFDSLVKHSESLLSILRKNGIEINEDHGFSWPNYIFESNTFRRAHLDVVDARETKRLYMMHLCIFPHTDDNSPIYGFDLIAGPNKVTGAFHDFSPTLDSQHDMCKWFNKRVKSLQWSKERELPEWAKNIFSKSMVAAGNINTVPELKTILDLSEETLLYYLKNIGQTSIFNSKDAQNYYCENQRKNPHTPKVMESLGLPPEDVQKFISDCLFPSCESPGITL
jgi:hypothetical protein